MKDKWASLAKFSCENMSSCKRSVPAKGRFMNGSEPAKIVISAATTANKGRFREVVLHSYALH